MIRWKKKNVIILFTSNMITALIVYYNLLENPEDRLIRTSGCLIPNYLKTVKYFEPEIQGKRCGQRLVHIDHVSDHEIEFRIDKEMFKKMNYATFSCGYVELMNLSNITKGILSNIKPFISGQKVNLINEISMFIICSKISITKLKTFTEELPKPVYTDFYALLKKRGKKKEKMKDSKKMWNVMMLGMEHMSRGRMYHSMPRLVQYFQQNGWLDYRAFHKVTDNNIIPLLTGKKIGTKLCPNLDTCRFHSLWHKYDKAGYMTALGEDSISNDSFIADMASHYFTDHHLNILQDSQRGNFRCYRQISTGEQLLDYALQFAKAYKKQNYFGLFWSSTFSQYYSNGNPGLFQDPIINFFDRLVDENLLYNTFVLFFGDSGLKFGPTMNSTEYYYDSRLSGLFLWVPLKFRGQRYEKYKNLVLNQNRLITHYDVHSMLEHILKFSNYDADVNPENRTSCANLFRPISPSRTCKDADIDEHLCSCHNMVTVNPGEDEQITQSLYLALSEITRILSAINYKHPNRMCSPLTFSRVLRNHYYKSGDSTFYITAGIFEENMTFEAVVEEYGAEYQLISVRSLTALERKNSCVNDDDPVKEFCLCKKTIAEPTTPVINEIEISISDDQE